MKIENKLFKKAFFFLPNHNISYQYLEILILSDVFEIII